MSNLVDNHVTTSADAVWAIAPNFRVARLDAMTGKITATTNAVPAAVIAAGRAGVWVGGVDGSVARLDERTAKPVRRTTIPGFPGGIAVGDDAAWVTSPGDGRLWRIGAGRARSLGATQLDPGIGDVAVSATGVWVANPIAGTLTHVDPDTTRIVRTIELDGIPRSVAVADDVVWVTLAQGATAATTSEVQGVTTFRTTTCEQPLEGPDGGADVLITSDLPLQGGTRVSATQMTQAIEFVLRERGFRAGRHRVAYQSCDDSVASTALFDEAKCAANARAYAQNANVVGVIGTMNSPCAVVAVPELNRADGGSLAMVSPLNSFVGLTRPGPGVDPALPAALYPTGTRSFLRVYPTDDLEGAALALFARDAGAERVFVLDDGETAYGALQATAFETAAGRVGLDVVGRESWDPRAAGYEDLARRVAASGARAVYLGGLVDTNAARVIRDLRSQLGRSVVLLGPSGLSPVPQLVKKSKRAAIGMYVAFAGILTEGLPPAGARWAKRFGTTQRGAEVAPEAIYTAQAAEVLPGRDRALGRDAGVGPRRALPHEGARRAARQLRLRLERRHLGKSRHDPARGAPRDVEHDHERRGHDDRAGGPSAHPASSPARSRPASRCSGAYPACASMSSQLFVPLDLGPLEPLVAASVRWTVCQSDTSRLGAA